MSTKNPQSNCGFNDYKNLSEHIVYVGVDIKTVPGLG